MSLVKRGKIWHVRTQVAGVTIAKSTKTANRRVAEQLEAKWISEVHFCAKAISLSIHMRCAAYMPAITRTHCTGLI